MASEIRDINLAPSGELKIEWVKKHCDLLRTLEEEFSKFNVISKFIFIFYSGNINVNFSGYPAVMS